MNLDALWHDLECGSYQEDLPLWRTMAAEEGGDVLDIGAGTGRVSVCLATEGFDVVALDADAPLLAALAHRGAGLPVETVVAGARDFTLGQRRFSLVLVPMQTLQLLGTGGRTGFLRSALRHMEPGALLAAALADPLDCFDDDRDAPPPAAVCDVAGVRYASQLLAVVAEGEHAAIHRRREIIGPDGHHDAEETVLRLDRISSQEVAREAGRLGFRAEPDRAVSESEEYLGSTVVVLRAP